MESLWVQQGNLNHAQIGYVLRVKFSLSGTIPSLVVKELPPCLQGAPPSPPSLGSSPP